MSDYYTLCAEEYHRQTFFLDPSSFLLPLQQRLAPGSLILDVGCGSGRDLLWFKKRGFRVIGFERSFPLACLARGLVGCEVVVGDFERFDFSRWHVDALLLVGALVHVPHTKFARIFRHILSAVNPGGVVLLSVKEGHGDSRDSRGRIFYYWSKAEMAPVLESLDLQQLDMRRQISVKDPRDVWLSYILRKNKPKGGTHIGGHGLSQARTRQDPGNYSSRRQGPCCDHPGRGTI